MKRHPSIVIVGLTAFMLLASNTSAALAQRDAQTGDVDLSQFAVPSDVIGDGWSIEQQEPAQSYSQPTPLAGYQVRYTNGPDQIAFVSLFAYADRASALASLNDPYGYWGHGNTTIQKVTGYGDGPTYRAYSPGIGQTSGITFVDGSVVAYVSVDVSRTKAEADALCDSLAAAQEGLIEGSPATPTNALMS